MICKTCNLLSDKSWSIVIDSSVIELRSKISRFTSDSSSSLNIWLSGPCFFVLLIFHRRMVVVHKRMVVVVVDMVVDMVEVVVDRHMELVQVHTYMVVVVVGMELGRMLVVVGHKLVPQLDRSSYNDGDRVVVVGVEEELVLLEVLVVLVVLEVHRIHQVLVVLEVLGDHRNLVLLGVPLVLDILVDQAWHMEQVVVVVVERMRMGQVEEHTYKVVEGEGRNKPELVCNHKVKQISLHLKQTILKVQLKFNIFLFYVKNVPLYWKTIYSLVVFCENFLQKRT